MVVKVMMCMFWEYFDGSWSSDTDKGKLLVTTGFGNIIQGGSIFG